LDDPVGDPERFGLEQFQCQLLGEHGVAIHKATLGHEAPHTYAFVVLVELLDLHLVAIPDAIVRAGCSANHVKVP
jgi:hypothetical protein